MEEPGEFQKDPGKHRPPDASRESTLQQKSRIRGLQKHAKQAPYEKIKPKQIQEESGGEHSKAGGENTGEKARNNSESGGQRKSERG